MANHLHLHPDDASELPRLVHWVGWYSAMALNQFFLSMRALLGTEAMRYCDCQKSSSNIEY
jgi:hypothetical protein